MSGAYHGIGDHAACALQRSDMAARALGGAQSRRRRHGDTTRDGASLAARPCTASWMQGNPFGRVPSLLLPIALACCLGLLDLPSVQAQSPDLTVRSGEHSGFTRLAFALPPGTSWRLGRTGHGYLLRLDETNLKFDLSMVYDRIARHRLSDIRVAGDASALDMTVPCDCHAIAFEDGQGLLVIDIHAGPPTADSPFERVLGDSPRVASVSSLSPMDGAAVVDGGQGLPSPRPVYDWIKVLNLPALPTTRGLGRETAPSHGFSPAGVARDMLMHKLAQAASQGLVELPPAELPRQIAAGPPRTPLPHAPQPELPPEQHTGPAQHLRIHAETAIDRAARDIVQSPAAEALECLPDTAFAVPEWGDDAPHIVQISARRRELVGEFDRPDLDALEAFVRLHIHLGFGVEAHAALQAFSVELPDAAVLEALATIVEEGAARGGTPFDHMAGCDGAVALWAVLAEPAAVPDSELNQAAILRSFSALPLHLRRHLGPALTERLLQADAVHAAHTVRDAISRAPGEHGADLAIIEAGIDLVEGRTATALRRLAEVAADNGPHAPEALALMIDTRLAAGERLTTATADNLAALAFEHRGSDMGARLARLEVLALAAAGRFGEGFEARDRLARQPGEARTALTEGLFRILSEQGSDADFLIHSFAETGWHGGAFPAELRLALATRLLDLGFPEAARRALPPADTASPAEKLLHARAALASAAPQESLGLLAHLDGAEAARLRGDALMQLGERHTALAAYRIAGAEASQIRAAWLADDPAAIAARDNDLRSTASDHPRGLEPDSADSHAPDAGEGPGPSLPVEERPEAGTLAHGRELLDRSRAGRELLDELLAAHAMP
jgi:hypothetical protein